MLGIEKSFTLYYTVLMSYFIIFAFHFSHFTPFLCDIYIRLTTTCTVRAYVGVDLLPPGGSLIVQCSSVMESSSNFYDLADLASELESTEYSLLRFPAKMCCDWFAGFLGLPTV